MLLAVPGIKLCPFKLRPFKLRSLRPRNRGLSGLETLVDVSCLPFRISLAIQDLLPKKSELKLIKNVVSNLTENAAHSEELVIFIRAKPHRLSLGSGLSQCWLT